MKIVVIGAGAAGMAAATRARRTSPSARIVIVEATSEFARGTCSLPYFLSGEVSDRTALQGTTVERLAEQKLDLMLNTRVLSIQPHQRKVITERAVLEYDKLIVGTGSRPRTTLTTPSLPQPFVWTLRTISDVVRIDRMIRENYLSSAAVVGGGYVGLEFAEALTLRGLEVSLYHQEAQLMDLDSRLSELLVEQLKARGVEVHLNTEVSEVTASPSIHFSDRAERGFQAVGLALGIEPEVELLREAGANLGQSGAVRVNSRGETSLSNIYACGDGVEVPHREGGRGRWLPLATTAARLGRVCGENAAGGSARLGACHGSLVVRLFGRQIGIVGGPRDWEECERLPFEWGSDNSPFPRRGRGTGLLFFHRRTKKLKGLQVFGPEVVSLVDVVSLGVEREMTVDDLEDQDYPYNPPLGGLWHPLYYAARTAGDRCR